MLFKCFFFLINNIDTSSILYSYLYIKRNSKVIKRVNFTKNRICSYLKKKQLSIQYPVELSIKYYAIGASRDLIYISNEALSRINSCHFSK